MSQAVARVGHLLDMGGHHQVMTLNPEFLMRARRDPAFAQVIARASLVVPDGTGIVWALRRQGWRNVGRVPGVELSLELARLAAQRDLSIYLLGAAPGVAAAAAQRLQAVVPGLRIAGTEAGSPDPALAPSLCAQIRASGAGILLVAFGFPAQDFWIADYQTASAATVAMGVGGTFDYLSGRVPRAPRWLREHGLEWCYRLVRQPWRWRRQRALLAFAWLVLRESPGRSPRTDQP